MVKKETALSLARTIAHCTFRKTRVIELTAEQQEHVAGALEILSGPQSSHSFMCVRVAGSVRDALLEGTVYEFNDPTGEHHSTRIPVDKHPDTPEGLISLLQDITGRHPKTVVLVLSKQQATAVPQFVEYLRNTACDARLVITDRALIPVQ